MSDVVSGWISSMVSCCKMSWRLALAGLLFLTPEVKAQEIQPSAPTVPTDMWYLTEQFLDYNQDQISQAALDLDIQREFIETSPVLQRWLDHPPNLLEEIRNTPAVPTRLQAGIEADFWSVGLSDLQLLNRVTLSGDYRQGLDQPDNQQYGSALRYFLAPSGSFINVAPQIGYRRVDQSDRTLSGIQYGAYLLFAPASGAADITISYLLLDPVEEQEGWATIADITAAYALSPSIRLAGRYRWQNSTIDKERTFGVVLEWVP